MNSPSTPDVASALWDHVEENWESEKAHEAFVNACAEENNLAFAAQKYRQQMDAGDNARHELSTQKLDAITAMALAQMAAMKSSPTDNKRAITIVAALVSCAIILACVYLLTL